MKLIDLTEKTFGRLTAKWPAGTRKEKIVWLCVCECGALHLVQGANLTSGQVKSCGCAQWRSVPNNRTGETYGLLTVEKFAGRTPRGMLIWQCRCKCGEKIPVRYGNLQSGHTISCGCQRKGNNGYKKHGATSPSTDGRTPTYRSYSAAKERCNNPHNHNYHYYGAQGIEFRFLSFKDFLAELGERPKGTTCDRYPNPAGHYEPGNVRWATPIQQRHNRRAS
jgi:hypothetical protein